VTKACFEVLLEVFGRVLRTELGEREGRVEEVEHVC
jgi:carboxymethylenebutenolidase